MPKQVTINHEQRLYVIPSGDGYSCLGFDFLEERLAAVSDWLLYLGERSPWSTYEAAQGPIGTPERYALYQYVMDLGANIASRYGKRCEAELTPQLRGLEGKRVEVGDAYGDKRKFQVGRSTGWLPIHLEIVGRNSTGGGGVTGTPFKSVTVIR